MHSPEVIVVGALATKGSNIAPLRYSAEAIAQNKGSVHYVHGGRFDEAGRLSVATPLEQAAEITAIIEQAPKTNYLLLSQSMGALATLDCLERFNEPTIKAISIAPPLNYPSDVIRHPRITTMSKIKNGQLILPSRSFALGDSGPTKHVDPSELPAPLDLVVPTALFEEIEEVNSTYYQRTYDAIARGYLRVIMPTDDWNQSAIESSQSLPDVTRLKGPHSLITDDALLQHNVSQIVSLSKTL